MTTEKNVWIIGPCKVAKTWDRRPKGCYDPHPLSRRCCELPPDGHWLHMVLHPNGHDFELWGDAPEEVERIPGAVFPEAKKKKAKAKPLKVGAPPVCGKCFRLHHVGMKCRKSQESSKR